MGRIRRGGRRRHSPAAAGSAAPPSISSFWFCQPARGNEEGVSVPGEDVFIAAEGDIVDRRYRVLHISSTAVDVEDVLNNHRQSLPLTQG